MIEELLGNRYKIIERIGGGGMANVYKAHDEKLDREVALKILKKEFVDDKEFVNNFKSESHSAARLNHPNIVSVFDVGMEEIDDEKNYYIVMELVKGRTLKEVIEEKGHLSVQETLYYAKQISEALVCAHDNGIIHRDIKPQNILINQENIAKVADFGIAQGVNNATISSNDDVLGSVHYISPEQAKGEKTDERSDIYSLGIVLYEMLTGELPFNGENPITIALKQVQEEIKIPSTINSEIPQKLDQIILKMTNKDPDYRYFSMKEVLEDLKKVDANTDLENSDTLVIPISNRDIKATKETVDSQRKIRRSSLQSENINKRENTKMNKKKKKSGGFLSIILGIILALLVATFGFVMIYRYWSGSSNTKEVEVPEIIGVQEEDARKMIEDRGLKFEVTDRLINHEFNPGDIIYQSVNAGEKVKEGFTIRVTVNTDEAGLIEVKNYISLDIEEVKSRLKSDGLVLAGIEYEEVDNEDNIGKVLEQDLRSGTKVKKDTEIAFTVGKEKELKDVKMPDLIGTNIDKAIKILEDNNLKKGSVSEREDENFDEGDVISQSVDAGDEIPEGTEVNLVIAIKAEDTENETNMDENNQDVDANENNGKDDNTENTSSNKNNSSSDKKKNKVTSIPVGVPDGKDSARIVVKRIDGETSTEVYNEVLTEDDGQVSITLTGYDDSIYQVFVDGVLSNVVQ